MKDSNTLRFKKVRDMVQAIIVDKNNDFVRKEFNNNCVISNTGGIALGVESFIPLYMKFHESINMTNYKIEDELTDSKTIVCRFIVEGIHVGEFSHIQATGKTVKFSSCSIVHMESGKISTVSASSDTDSIIRQLTDKPTDIYKNNSEAERNINFSENAFNLTRFHLASEGINITHRQLVCLCLTTLLLSASEISSIMKISAKTVNCYQESLKAAFKCRRRHQLIEKLKDMRMTSMVNLCLTFINQ